MELPDFLKEEPDGFIHFTGHRIGLMHVVDLYNDRYSPEMLADHFPTLPLPLIHKAIAFYLENRDEVDTYIADERTELQRLEATLPRGPSLEELRRRMQSRRSSEAG